MARNNFQFEKSKREAAQLKKRNDKMALKLSNRAAQAARNSEPEPDQAAESAGASEEKTTD